MMRKPTTHRQTKRRTPSLRLDPYALDETTITLEEWRRLDRPAPVPPRTPAPTRPHQHAA